VSVFRIAAKRHLIADDLLIELGGVCAISLLLICWCAGQSHTIAACACPVLLFLLGWSVPGLRGRLHDYGLLPVEEWKGVTKLSGAALVLALLLLAAALTVAKLWQLNVPLISPSADTQWGMWVLFQFTHIALPEEVFFRGYLLSGLLQWGKPKFSATASFNARFAIIVSSAVFAVFHMLVQQSVFGLLTFFPGLLLGVLFVKTRSLLIPVVFHAVANIAYALGVSVLY